MIISEALAKTIADQMLTKQSQELTEVKQKLKEEAYSIVHKSIPKQVIECLREYPSYFELRDNFMFAGHGINHEYISLKSKLPSSSSHFAVQSDEDGNSLRRLLDEKENKISEIDRLKREIKSALLSLRTFKMVEANFPEAAVYLPVREGKMMPMVQIESIREQLKK